MNFEEWYDEDNSAQDFDQCRLAWASCKREVLRILENNPKCDDYYFDLKDEIEKL